MSNEDENAKPPREKPPCDGFPIREFPDMRELRKTYIKCGDAPVGVDSADNPLPDESEEDFGLTRSTPEEALDFLREAVTDCDDDDPLAEFLDDE